MQKRWNSYFFTGLSRVWRIRRRFFRGFSSSLPQPLENIPGEREIERSSYDETFVPPPPPSFLRKLLEPRKGGICQRENGRRYYRGNGREGCITGRIFPPLEWGGGGGGVYSALRTRGYLHPPPREGGREEKGRVPDRIENTGERIVAMAIGRQRSGGRGREKRK